jgi:hypothetical protein
MNPTPPGIPYVPAGSPHWATGCRFTHSRRVPYYVLTGSTPRYPAVGLHTAAGSPIRRGEKGDIAGDTKQKLMDIYFGGRAKREYKKKGEPLPAAPQINPQTFECCYASVSASTFISSDISESFSSAAFSSSNVL